MGPTSLSLSPLEQFLTIQPVPESSNNSEVSAIDLENICALRQRSIRKFVRTLEEIAIRYDGDGDEEADDVIDLEHLEVVEDRGYILNRFSHQIDPSKSSSTPSKGKGRADTKLGIFDMLDPTALDGDDEWVEDEHAEDEDDATSETHSVIGQDPLGHDDDSLVHEGYNHHNSDSFSIISDPSSSSCKNAFQEKAAIRRKLVYPNSTCSSSVFSDPPPIESFPQQQATSISCLDSPIITNELFERLKKRIQERSSDIKEHRLYKQSINRHQVGPKNVPSFSSPNSSLFAPSSLSSALTPTENIISPYLQRLLYLDHSANYSWTKSHLKSLIEPVNIVPRTPTTARKSQLRDFSSAGVSALREEDTIIGKTKRRRKSSLESSPFLGTPSHHPDLIGKISPATSRIAERHSNLQDFVEDTSSMTTIDQIKPALLFKNALSEFNATSDPYSSKSLTPGCRHPKKLKSDHLLSDESEDKPDLNHMIEKSRDDQFSRESSEDPLYLPPGRLKKSKPKTC